MRTNKIGDSKESQLKQSFSLIQNYYSPQIRFRFSRQTLATVGVLLIVCGRDVNTENMAFQPC